jgi:hypothetical protein
MLLLPVGETQGDGAELSVPATVLWSSLVGSDVVLTGSVASARALLLRTLGIEPGVAVAVPANAQADLVEALKGHGVRPIFTELDPLLGLATGAGGPPVTWANPATGLPVRATASAGWVILDCADTWPNGPLGGADALLCSLHLAPALDARGAVGALLAFRDPRLARRAAALRDLADRPDERRAVSQALRARALLAQQRQRLAEVRRGLAEAAGLPLLPVSSSGGLPHGVAVQVPDESDVSTFLAYVRGEHTPVIWLPELQPLHRAAAASNRISAERLARWLLVPVWPDDSAEEIRHAVLGIVKAAEYLGVRWRTDPARAAWYAELMNEMYGPGHDAYRPAFAIGNMI